VKKICEFYNVTEDQIQCDWQRAAGAIDRASAVFIGSGADMALDSGLPDFSRMLEPQNEALPTMFRKTDLVTSGRDVDSWFRQHPEQAWGFFAHQLNLVRHTTPHTGFGILNHWVVSKALGAFVVTSNIDGHFEKAGFDPDRICEIRGSLHWLQPLKESIGSIPPWSAAKVDLKVDGETGCALGELPIGPDGCMARPNVQMTSDGDWDPVRMKAQQLCLRRWIQDCTQQKTEAVVIEIGTGVGSCVDEWDRGIRSQCALVAAELQCLHIRIHPLKNENRGDAGEVLHLQDRAITALARLHFLIASGQVA